MLVVNLFVPHQLLKRWWTMFGRIMNVSPQRTTQLTNWTQYIDELSVLVHNKEGDEYSVGVVIWFLLCPRYLFVLPQIYSSLRERTIHIYIYSSCLYYFRKVCPYAFITAHVFFCHDRGNHNELLKANGAYARLVQKQLKQRASIVDADRCVTSP